MGFFIIGWIFLGVREVKEIREVRDITFAKCRRAVCKDGSQQKLSEVNPPAADGR